MNTDTLKRGLNTKEAANYLGLSESALRQGRTEGHRQHRIPPPPFVKVGKKVVYLIDDLDGWLEGHRVTEGAHE